MHKIFFYRDRNGNEPVLDYLRELSHNKDKDSRIKAGKINDYIEILSANVKHFFTCYGKIFFTSYGKEFFTSFGKHFFTWSGKHFLHGTVKSFFASR